MRHPGQLLLAVLGVGLGVAVVVALDLAIQSSRAAFRASSEMVAGRATHAVLGGPDGLPDSAFLSVRVRAGIRGSAPVVEGRLTSTELPGRSIRVLGVDPLSEGPVRPYLVGRTGAADGAVLLSDPGGVFLSRTLAEEGGLATGDSLVLRAGGTLRSVRVAGILDPVDEVARQGSVDLLVTDIAVAQELLGRVGRLSRIDLVLEDPGSEEALAALAGVLPPDARIEPTGSRARTMEQMTRAFDLNLTALSLLAMVFGMFLIYNTMTFSVVQRRELFGALRSLGVTGRELVSGVLWEAGVLALAGAALGVALLGGLFPSLEASRTLPREALYRGALERRLHMSLGKLSLIGALILAVGYLCSQQPAVAGLPLFGFIAAFLILAGFSFLTPASVLLVNRALAPGLAALFKIEGKMAGRYLSRSVNRSAVAIASLMTALAMLISISIMIISFRQTVVVWTEQIIAADLYISPAVRLTGQRGNLPVELVESLPDLPGFLAQFDILLLPSIWEEPLARIMQEGLASGMVVVGSSTGGTKETIIDGENGLLFPAGDGQELAEALVRLIDEPSLRATLAQNGKHTAEEQFDIPTPNEPQLDLGPDQVICIG